MLRTFKVVCGVSHNSAYNLKCYKTTHLFRGVIQKLYNTPKYRLPTEAVIVVLFHFSFNAILK